MISPDVRLHCWFAGQMSIEKRFGRTSLRDNKDGVGGKRRVRSDEQFEGSRFESLKVREEGRSLHFDGNGKWEVRKFLVGSAGLRALFAGFGGKFPERFEGSRLESLKVPDGNGLHFEIGEADHRDTEARRFGRMLKRELRRIYGLF